jgi:hypothetical protein
MMYVDIANRPYLNWIFNEPMDNVNANSFFTDDDSYAFIKLIEGGDVFDYNALIESNFWRKGKPIRYDDYTNTIELRIFEMVENEEELVALINFVCNYYERFLMTHDQKHLAFYNDKPFELQNKILHTPKNFASKTKLKNYLLEFKNLCTELELDYNDYITFIERNYKTRIKWGKKFLK